MRALKTGLFRGMGPDAAVDLGTVNTFIAVRGRGIVLREPSAVAVSCNDESRVLAVGREALGLLGRAPGKIRLLYPMRDGVVAQRDMCQAMLEAYLRRALGCAEGERAGGAMGAARMGPARMGAARMGPARMGSRLGLCAPMCVTAVEQRALREAVRGLGAEAVCMEEPLAAAVGAGLPVNEAVGSMVVDVGGGTTDVAVLSLGGVVVSRSVRAGGVHMDAAIAAYVDKAYGVCVGSRSAEDIKRKLGSAFCGGETLERVRGRSRESGLPVTLTLKSSEVAQAMEPVLKDILGAVRETLSETPPELSGDIAERGIALCGGGAKLRGLDRLIARETGVPVFVAEDPMACVAVGTMRAMAERLGPAPAQDFGSVDPGEGVLAW